MAEKTGSELPMPAGFDDMVKLNGKNMEAVAKSSGIAFEGMTRMSEELFQFGFRRLREDMGLMSKLVGCGSPQQVAETQMDFVARMVADYNDEARRLMDLATNITEDTCAAAEQGLATSGEKPARKRAR
ncbi:MAG: phasin family protein [Hyphomicrobiales bacterium]